MKGLTCDGTDLGDSIDAASSSSLSDWFLLSLERFFFLDRVRRLGDFAITGDAEADAVGIGAATTGDGF